MKIASIIGFAVWSLGLMAQSEKRTYIVHLNDNEKDLTANVSVLARPQKFAPNENLSYFWYAAGKVQETRGGFDGKLLGGPYVSFYINGNLKEKGQFKKGLKDGKWNSWTSAGSLKESVTWRKGIKHGQYVLFNEEGKKVLKANYRNDQLQGKVEVYEAGKLVGVKRYKRGKEIVKSEVKTAKKKFDWFKRKKQPSPNPKREKEKKKKHTPEKNEITKT